MSKGAGTIGSVKMVSLRGMNVRSRMARAFSSVKQRKGINPIRGFLPRRLGSLSLRICASLFIVAAITFVLFRLVPVNAAAVGFLYLVAVLFIATKGGIVESTIASLAAVLCFNFFFLPPIGTLTISAQSE